MALGTSNKAGNLTPLEISLFFKEYHLLFSSGITLSDAAYIMATGGSDKRFASIGAAIASDIDEGRTLAQALDATGSFPQHVIHMVEIGQASGKLDEVLKGLAVYYDRQNRLEQSVRSALTYPLIMISVMVVVLGVLIIQVLPMFGKVFQTTGAKMPLILRLTTDSGAFTAGLIAVLAALLALTFVIATRAGRALTSGGEAGGFIGALPLLKSLSTKTAAGNWAYTMSLLLSGGVPLEDALTQTQELTGSQYAKDLSAKILELMSSGDSFATAVSKCNIFDGTYPSLLVAGEKAGQTDAIMNLIADRYTEEVDSKIHSILALIEPTLVIIISIVIGVILLSIMLPLMNVLGA